MSAGELATGSPEVPTGNTFDKYGSQNPLVRRLMVRFEADLDELLGAAAPDSILDVGCGEGVLTDRWARRLGDRRVVGVDLADAKLQTLWERRRPTNLEFRAFDGDRLPYQDAEFDLVAAIEVLEHVEDPAATLAEMARCAGSHLLVSVPREPLWRLLNVARGAYLGQLGNTPGHVNHFSQRAFVALLGRFGRVTQTRSPLPWTMALVRL